MLEPDISFQKDIVPIVDHVGQIGLNPKGSLSVAIQKTNRFAGANQAFAQFITGLRAGKTPLLLTIAAFLFKLQGSKDEGGCLNGNRCALIRAASQHRKAGDQTA